MVKAVEKFRVYLLGNPFKIVTDCIALKQTLNKKELSPRIARWVMLLEVFKYTIEHRPGSRMQHVDALSRKSSVLIVRGYFSSTFSSSSRKRCAFRGHTRCS